MADLNSVCAACGIIVDPNGPDGFSHVATAFSIGAGEWLSAWIGSEAPGEQLQLMSTAEGSMHPISDGEVDGGVWGFHSYDAQAGLELAEASQLRKRQHLEVIGYPSVIGHPAFNLHRGSLDGERYLPYLCPWALTGHLALYTVNSGWFAGQTYRGMQGAPVFGPDDSVVGVVGECVDAPDHPPLTRFLRVS